MVDIVEKLKLTALAALASGLRQPFAKGRVTLSEFLYRLLEPMDSRVVMMVCGRPIHLDLSEQELRYIYFGAFEIAERKFLKRYLKNDDVVIDVGANVGYLSALILCEIASKGKLYSFEPNPELLLGLERLKDSGHGSMEIIPLAVGANGSESDPQTLSLYTNPEHSMWASFVKGIEGTDDPTIMPVRSISLSNFFSDRNIRKVDFIKIDVEGFEFAVLAGLVQSLRAVGMPAILCEVSSGNNPNFDRTLFEIDHVIDLGYKIWTLNDKGMPVLRDFKSISATKEANNFLFAEVEWLESRTI